MTKYIYIVDYWYPLSEFGGMEVLIADSDQECINIIKKATTTFAKEMYPAWAQLIEHVVENADRYPLAGEPESGFVASFTT